MTKPETRSLAEIFIDDYTEEEREEIYSSMTQPQLEALQYDANYWLRPSQQIPEGDWFITAIIAGRGFGKTRAMSEWVRKKAMEKPGCRIAVAGRTSGDVRRVMVEGESGILAVCPEAERPTFNQQKQALYFPNGSLVELHSSESPDSARGPQYDYAVGDEFAAWKTNTDSSGATLYTNLIMATRLGTNPQMVLATTPKRTKPMKDIIERSKDPKEKIEIVRGSTLENSSLPSKFINNLFNQFGGSDLAKQEIEGQMLEDSEGVVFTTDMFALNRVDVVPANARLRFIAVDPSVSADVSVSDECGIVAISTTTERDLTQRTAYIVEDYSLRATPDVWAEQVVIAAKEHRTKFVIVEANQGGDLLRMVIVAKDPSLKVYTVHATKGKLKRTEPIVIAMQQKRVKFVGEFLELEDQMLYYDPANSNYSPDRMDAAVWGLTAALIEPPKGMRTAVTSSASPAHRKLPTGIGQGRARSVSSLRNRGGRGR